MKNLVLSVDDDKLTETMLEQLLKYMPNRDEVGGGGYSQELN